MKLVIKPLEWGVFANEFTLNSSYILIVGSTVGMMDTFFPRWQIAIYSLFFSIFIFILEYPRMYRKDLFAAERMYQGYLEHFIMKLGTYGRSYYVRFYVYLCLSIPCFFLLPTIFGGACVMTGSLVYLKAALSGFEWQPFPRSSERSIAVRDVKPDYSQIYMMRETVC